MEQLSAEGTAMADVASARPHSGDSLWEVLATRDANGTEQAQEKTPRVLSQPVLAARKVPWRTPWHPLAAPELSTRFQSELLRNEPNAKWRNSVIPQQHFCLAMEDVKQEKEPRTFPESVTGAVCPGPLPTHLHVGTGTGLDAAGATKPVGAVGHLHQAAV